MTSLELGHYRIENQLGSGGMGAVYRAADLRSGQFVAIKTLLASRLHDVEQRKRFQQEARLASSLQHPNIVHILEIGAAQVDGDLVDYIAMELVDGSTLDELLASAPLSQNQTIDYGIQLANGLAAAHAANIVHRDLKPSNVMVTREGVVKILDFGLAKWTNPLQPDGFSETKSVPNALTMAGTIIGSVAYMSPEQAEGKPLDHRTDVFSFGSVLYRIAAGQDPFKGSSQVATLSAVLLKEPEPLADLRRGIDPRLEFIIRKCLRKDPAKRWQSMADLALSLEELRDELGRARAAPAPIVLPPAAAPSCSLWLFAGVGLLLGVLGASSYFLARRAPQATFQRLTFRRGDISSALFAPRGEVMYTAHWDGSPEATFSSLPGSREARDLGLPKGVLLSINSKSEALVLSDDKLVRAGVGGGAARSVLDHVCGASWGPNGTDIAVVRTVDHVNRLEYPIGNILFQGQERPICWIRVSPLDGAVAFFDYDAEVGDYDLKIVDAAKQVKLLSRGWRTVGRLGWSPDGKEVWISGGRPGESPQITSVTRQGKERMLAQLPGFMVLHDIAADGSLLLADVHSKIALGAQGPMTKEEVDLSWFDASFAYDISSDGQSVVFVELAYGEGRNSAIYVRKTDGAPAVKIGYGNRPAMSPDGKQVVCIFRQAQSSVLKILATGAGEENVLSTDGMKYEYAEWFPDQQRLLVTTSAPGKPLRTYWRSLHDGRLHPVTPEGVRASRVSPDGRWAVAAVGGKFRLYAVDGSTPQDLGTARPGDLPLRWNTAGTGLYVGHPRELAVDVDVIDVSGGFRHNVREIRYPEDGAEFDGLVLTPDAKWYALSYQKDWAELYIARGIR